MPDLPDVNRDFLITVKRQYEFLIQGYGVIGKSLADVNLEKAAQQAAAYKSRAEGGLKVIEELIQNY